MGRSLAWSLGGDNFEEPVQPSKDPCHKEKLTVCDKNKFNGTDRCITRLSFSVIVIDCLLKTRS